MLDMIISDVSAIFSDTFLNGDWVSLAIAFGSVLIAAVVMRRGTQIGSMTLLALALFAVGCFGRGLVAGSQEVGVTSTQALGQLESNWTQFMSMQAGTLLAYFVTFMLFIFALFALKSVVSRG